MWKHYENNMAPPSAVFPENGRFKGNNFTISKKK
jgi:hypothetical protein